MEEQWKDVPGYEGIYQVSNIGNVKSLERYVPHRRNGKLLIKGKKLNLGDNLNGYLRVFLCKNGKAKKVYVHQLVAMAFLGHVRCGFELVIDHINFNKRDNNVSNLRIITNRENSDLKHIKSTSKYIGVSWYKTTNKWRASMWLNGKVKHLGMFDIEEDAAMSYSLKLSEIKTNRNYEN